MGILGNDEEVKKKTDFFLFGLVWFFLGGFGLFGVFFSVLQLFWCLIDRAFASKELALF